MICLDNDVLRKFADPDPDPTVVDLDLADLLVAATARDRDATLATANRRDFDKPPIHQLLDADVVETS